MTVANSVECLQARPILMRALEEGNFDALVDPRLGNDYDRNEITRMVACAAACVRHSAKRRPRMTQVTVFPSILYFPFSSFLFSIFPLSIFQIYKYVILCFPFFNFLFL